MSTIVIVDPRPQGRARLAALAASVDGVTRVKSFDGAAGALPWVAENGPDLVIAHHGKRAEDGAEFVRRLRRLPTCSDLPVVVVTPHGDGDARYVAFKAGATDFLLSPVDDREFKARVGNLLMLRAQERVVGGQGRFEERDAAIRVHPWHRALPETEEMLRRVIDTVPAMICASDRAGRLVFVNRQMAARWGPPSELLGQFVEDIMPGDSGGREQRLNAKVLDGKETLPSYEEAITFPDGRGCYCLTTKAPLFDSRGEVTSVVTISLDITARKQAEEELRRARDSAEMANRAKTEFLATMSHELRTPLNAVMGFSEAMMKEIFGPLGDARYREYAGNIKESGEHLLNLISDLLDVSKAGDYKIKLAEKKLDVAATIASSINLVRQRADGPDVEIVVNVPKNLPCLKADERRLKQVLINLLTNALKFTPKGGRVEIVADQSKTHGIRIEIADTGIGMAAADLPVALAPFGQLNADPLTKKHAGTGLGLPLSIGLMELHGGKLDIASEVGVGTRVTLEFPPERTSRPEHRERRRRPVRGAGNGRGPARKAP